MNNSRSRKMERLLARLFTGTSVGSNNRMESSGKCGMLSFRVCLIVLLLFSLVATGTVTKESIPKAEELLATNDGVKQAAGKLRFSEQPTDAEIFNARVFDEPLIPFGGKPNPAENAALAHALSAFAARVNPDDFSSLTSFLRAFPKSRWRGSLLLHLGTEYYNCGYYSRALDAWEKAWQASKRIVSGPAKAQADRALGELARMYANVGRTRDLAELLNSTKERPLEGPGTQLIEASRQVLWIMQNRPGTWFKCGPLALGRILARTDPAKAGSPLITQCKGTTNGFSLDQVAHLSRQLGMDYQMAFRSNGAPVIVPSVVNWKVGHYAALVQSNGDRFLAKDPTFRTSPWITAATLDDEASGYFLVPPGPLPTGWRSVEVSEAQQVWGKGPPNGLTPGATSKYDSEVGGNKTKCRGMTTYTMHTMLASLSLNDTPVGYLPPVGPPVEFTATYSQREASQPATFYYSNLGPKWTCNWISYINDNPASPAGDVSYYVDGGGSLTFTGFNSYNQTYVPERMSHAFLTKTSSTSYKMLFPDGSERIFSVSDGSLGTSRRIFLSQVVDSAGNSVQLNYDSQFRITNITDTIGQSTTLSYTNADYPYAITSVTDPFGRTAHFEYNSSGQLIQITDAIGITSQFTYGASDFISALTTPYGTTTFASGVTNSVTYLQATDPLGASELLEVNQNTPISSSDPAADCPPRHGALEQLLDLSQLALLGQKGLRGRGGRCHQSHHLPLPSRSEWRRKPDHRECQGAAREPRLEHLLGAKLHHLRGCQRQPIPSGAHSGRWYKPNFRLSIQCVGKYDQHHGSGGSEFFLYLLHEQRGFARSAPCDRHEQRSYRPGHLQFPTSARGHL